MEDNYIQEKFLINENLDQQFNNMISWQITEIEFHWQKRTAHITFINLLTYLHNTIWRGEINYMTNNCII